MAGRNVLCGSVVADERNINLFYLVLFLLPIQTLHCGLIYPSRLRRCGSHSTIVPTISLPRFCCVCLSRWLSDLAIHRCGRSYAFDFRSVWLPRYDFILSPSHVLTYIYIWGRVYFRLFYLDCHFDLPTVALIVLSSSRAWSDPAVGVCLFQVASTVGA